MQREKQAAPGKILRLRQELDELAEELKQKVDELEPMEFLNQTLIIKEKKSNDELQDTRKELIDVNYHIDLPAIEYYALVLSQINDGT